MYFDGVGRLAIRNGVNGSYRYRFFDDNAVLLGSNYEDVVFVGYEGEDGRISRLTRFYVDPQGGFDPSDITLPVEAAPEDIVFDYNSHLYVVDRDRKAVIDVTDGKSISYENDFVAITQTHIVTISGNTLKLTRL
jgi:hypothetical protein